MRKYSGDTLFMRLESQTLAKKQSRFKVIFVTQIDHRHCLARTTFILGIYLL